MMDVLEFEDLLGRHGDDLSSWPEERRAAAETLLQSSEQARTALAETRRLRSALKSKPVRAPSGLVDRIMGQVRPQQSDPADESLTDVDGGSPPPRKQ